MAAVHCRWGFGPTDLTMTFQMEFAQKNQSDVWSARLTLLVVTYAAIALILQPKSYLAVAAIYAGKFIVSIPILLVVGLGSMALLFGRDAPTRYAIRVLKERWHTLATVMVFFFIGLTAFTTYKSAIPAVVPYYADQWLADMDEWLHGDPAWKLAHRFSSEIWSLFVLKCYDVVWFAQWFGTILYVALWSNRVGRVRYLWAHALTLVTTGTILAAALSSVGPVFYDHFAEETRFHGLKAAMGGIEHSYLVRGYSDYLLTLYETGRSGFGGGISAMPSVHVALAVLNALFLSSLNRWSGAAGWPFAALIFYGSIYTGWHYAVDGYLAAAVALTMWWLTGRMIVPPLCPTRTDGAFDRTRSS